MVRSGSKPIDVDLVRQLFELPPSIVVSAERDTILDESTWMSIEGPLFPTRRSGDIGDRYATLAGPHWSGSKGSAAPSSRSWPTSHNG